MGPETTILDGSSDQESVVLFINGESRSAVLEGFTLTGGVGHDFIAGFRRGGGVYCAESSPTIRNNRIFKNILNNDVGGGFYLALPESPINSVSPMIENNIFEENFARNGGGIRIDGGHPIIRGNIFRKGL